MGFMNTLISLLIVFGAINWGLVGLFKFDFVEYICKGRDNIYAKIIYVIIGLAGAYALIGLFLS